MHAHTFFKYACWFQIFIIIYASLEFSTKLENLKKKCMGVGGGWVSEFIPKSQTEVFYQKLNLSVLLRSFAVGTFIVDDCISEQLTVIKHHWLFMVS